MLLMNLGGLSFRCVGLTDPALSFGAENFNEWWWLDCSCIVLRCLTATQNTMPIELASGFVAICKTHCEGSIYTYFFLYKKKKEHSFFLNTSQILALHLLCFVFFLVGSKGFDL